ncbi:MAG: sulfotransferase [Deltaproteobacteria bacterium]|nr:sulfotransferase [Deltaproteobacteria bacterium]
MANLSSQISELVALAQSDINLAKARFRQFPFAEISHKEDFLQFGQLALRLGFVAAAKQVFEKAIVSFPKESPLYNNLGVAFLNLNELEKAKAQFEQALSLQADYAVAMVNLAALLEREGDLLKAKALYEQAVLVSPEQIHAWVRLAFLAQKENATHDFNRCFERAHQINPEFPDVLHLQSIRLQSQKQFDDALRVIDQAIQKKSVPVFLFHKALLLEKLNRFEEAWKFFTQANAQLETPPDAIKQALLRSDQDLVNWYKSLSVDFFQNNDIDSKQEHNWLFVLSTPRSGTTLLCEMLGAHSAFQNHGELRVFQELYVKAINHLGCGDNMPLLASELWKNKNQSLQNFVRAEYQKLISDISFDSNKIWHIDKGIMNVFYLPLIRFVCPHAKFVHLVRDGREVAVSIYRQNFKEAFWFQTDPNDAMLYWASVQRLASHMAPLLSQDFVPLKYEDLVVSPTETLSAVLNLMNLEFQDSCLRFYENSGFVNTASHEQVRQQLNQSGMAFAENNYPDVWNRLGQGHEQVLKESGY